MAHYVGMDPTSKGYRERVMAGAKTYGEQAVAMAKQDLEIAESWWKTENWEAIQWHTNHLGNFLGNFLNDFLGHFWTLLDAGSIALEAVYTG